MARSIQSKGDFEHAYTAPFTGINVSVPSIVLPPNSVDANVSTSFSVTRGSITAPWPYSTGSAAPLFGFTLSSDEYFIFQTASGYFVTNLAIYQYQQASSGSAWQLVSLATMPSGAFPGSASPPILPTQSFPFLEANGCLYFSCLLGIYRYNSNNGITLWGNVDASTNLGKAAFYCDFMTIFGQRLVCVGTHATPTTPASPEIPISRYTIAWSTVSDFSYTSVGSFNTNPNVDAGVVGGFDVVTSYSQGFPVGIINLGHSFYIQMTQGIVEVDPSYFDTNYPFTFYSYWQERVPVGAVPNSVAQFGPIGAFMTPDNINIWSPGQQTQIGTPVMPLIRNIIRSAQIQISSVEKYDLQSYPQINASFLVVYGELHYVLLFNLQGWKPEQVSPPYPVISSGAAAYTLMLDYNFASASWSQQILPPIQGKLFQVIGPPCLSSSAYDQQIPQQNIIVGSSIDAVTDSADLLIIATDVFPQSSYPSPTNECQALLSQPQQCWVGFPQTTISSGRTPTFRRVRIEYSMDELSCGTETASVDITISIQGTVTKNTGASGGNGIFTTSLQSIYKTITVQPLGVSAPNVSPLPTAVPYLTSTAYADMVITCENPQISLSWTDPSSHQRLMIHRVSLLLNDTQGALQ